MVTLAEDSELLAISLEIGILGSSGNSKSSESEKLPMSLSMSFIILFGVFPFLLFPFALALLTSLTSTL